MKNTRKLLALVLVLMMVLPMFTVFASAAAPEILYLTPNANWKSQGARFAAYFFGNGEKWVSMTDSDGDGVYEVSVPAGYPNVIFCRMNPGATANNWNNKWNQTGDLTIPTDGPNHYTIKEGSWDAGSWSTFGSTCMHTNLGEAATCTTAQKCLDCGDPVVAELGHTYNTAHLCTRCNGQATFTVAGSGAHMNGEWAPANTANDLTYADGVYTKVYTNVAAGSYMLKVARDHDWGTAYPEADKSYTVAKAGSTVTVTLKGTTVTIDVVAPHTHVFTEGKCECGEIDPEYVAPHVNTLVVGDTNKIVVSGATLNDYGLPVEWVPFVANEAGYYSFVGDNGALAFIFTAEFGLVSATGAANLEAGTYLICLGNGVAGEFNVAVTKSAWVNALVVGENKLLITDVLDNGAGYYIVWVPFEVTEKANYTFTGEGILALVYDAAYGAVTGTELDVGTYNICVAFLTPATTGVATVKVEKTPLGDAPVVEDPALVLGDNEVVIDGTTTNLTGNAVAWYSFTPETSGTYTFACADLTIYILSSKNMGDLNAYVGNGGVADLEAGVTYHILVGKEGITGTFTVNVSVGGEVVEKNSIVVGDSHYVVTDALIAAKAEYLFLTITEPGTYVISGLKPLKTYVWTIPVEDLENGALTNSTPYKWNVDVMLGDGVDAVTDTLEVTFEKAGTYWVGINFDFVGEDNREYNINVSFKEALPEPEHTCESVCEECGKCTDAECTEAACADKCEGHEDAPVVDDPEPEPEMNFFEKIIALLMQLIDLIKKLLGM